MSGRRRLSRKPTQFSFEVPYNPEDDKFQNLVTEGQYLPGDSGIHDEGQDIPWLDMDLAQSGQEFVQKHIFALGIAHTFILLHMFSLKTISAVLIKTGKFCGLERALRRYLETLVHVLTWYRSDIIGKYAEGFQDICSVRHTHNASLKVCKNRRNSGVDFKGDEVSEKELMKSDTLCQVFENDLSFVDSSVYESLNLTLCPPVYMSQFDMAITQLAFVAPVALYPGAYGIRNTEGMKGFIHLWALIGHLMGIRPEYNFGLDPKREYFQKSINQIFLPSFKDMDALVMKIQMNFITVMKQKFGFLSLSASYYYILTQWDIEGFEGKNLYNSMDWIDKCCYYLLRFMVGMYYYIPLFRITANYFTNIIVRIMLKRLSPKDFPNTVMCIPQQAKNKTSWSKKYRKRAPAVLKKWKGAQNKLKIVSCFEQEPSTAPKKLL